jgi:ribokinase
VIAAVVGHIELVTFLTIDRPLVAGMIAQCPTAFDEPAGGGAMAAAELARLAGRCALYTGLGEDAGSLGISSRLAALGVDVVGTAVAGPHRRATTIVDSDGERTIIVVGASQTFDSRDPRLEALASADVVYFCKGDADALRAARRARVLVATARILPVIRASGVRLDALVRSARDDGERYAPGDLPVEPARIVATEGADGGSWQAGADRGRWLPAELPGPARDAYGAGDSFAAGLAFAIASGCGPQAACERGARSGAAALARRGAHG